MKYSRIDEIGVSSASGAQATTRVAMMPLLLPQGTRNVNHKAMTIYTFASDAPSRLFAFTGDSAGAALPAQHGPWRAVGDIGPDQRTPHQLDRKTIDQAIGEHGYQMWRMRKSDIEPEATSEATASDE